LANCRQCGAKLPSFSFGDASEYCKSCRAEGKRPSRPSFADELAPVAVPGSRFLNATNCLLAINIGVFIAMVVSGVSPIDPKGQDLLPWGADFGPKTLVGQYWRVLTASFLHFGVLHLALNMWCLWSLGRLAEKLIGRFATFAVYVTTAIGASILSLSWEPMRVSAGASGAIFGIAGVLISALYFGKLDLPRETINRLLRYVVRFALINLLYGLKDNVDNMAHLGGLVTGLLAGVFLARGCSLPLQERLLQGRKVMINAAILVVLVFVPVVKAKNYVTELARAEDALHRDDYAAAADHLKRYTASRPDDAYGHALLGYSFQQIDREDDALAEYQRGLALDPDNPFIQLHVAKIYTHREQFNEAIPLFRKGLVEINDDPAAYFAYGQALQRTGDLPEAEKALNHCVGMDNENIAAHTLLAAVLKAEGKSEMALQEDKYVLSLEKKKKTVAKE
jgi:rhomboid protease GluP